MSVCDVVPDVGDNGMGACDIVPDIGDDGVGSRDVTTNIRNGYMRIYCKLGLVVNSYS
jgi:hypothetical protein